VGKVLAKGHGPSHATSTADNPSVITA